MPEKRKHLTETEVKKILNASLGGRYFERNYCFVYMSFIHGLRVSEARYLKLSDIDLQEGILHIRRIKNGLCTNHPLLKREVKVIKSWLKARKKFLGSDSDWFFLSKKGKPLTRQRIYQLMTSLGIKANISINAHPHMLRHACGFALANRGVDTRLIQDYLGHRNIRHTVQYTASNSERFKNVWEFTKINKIKKLHLGSNC
ncbi:tyrosine-type DNA invertase [Providencia rettgeri]